MRLGGWSGRRAVALLVLLALAAIGSAFAAAYVAAPSAGDLAARVAAYERAHGVRPVALDRISPLLRAAVVAQEDERFYDHRGVDLIALMRAVPYDLAHWSLAQGASTITEQLAKIAYLGGDDRSPWRKLTDVALGFRLGHRYSHETILDDYLNVVYLGEGAYGVADAARTYFGRDVARLDLAQASLLAGLVEGPSVYDPLRNPAAARARQAVVLQSMIRNGYTTRADALRAARSPLRLASGHVLAPDPAVTFSESAPFDWDVLVLAAVLFAAALAAFGAARLAAPAFAVRVPLKAAAAVLLVLALLAAARSVQVV